MSGCAEQHNKELKDRESKQGEARRERVHEPATDHVKNPEKGSNEKRIGL